MLPGSDTLWTQIGRMFEPEQEENKAAYLHEMADLYSGDFLPGCHQEWIDPIRSDLHRIYLQALESLIDIHTAQGRTLRALHYAHRLLADDPLQDDIYGRIIDLHASKGDYSAVERTYRLYLQMIRQELNGTPAPSVEEAHRRARAMTRQSGIVKVPSVATPLVGRQREQAAVTAQLSDPRCRLLTIVGPGGIGKTRLALRVAETSQGFDHGALFVPLAGLESTGDVAAAVAAELELTGADGDSTLDALLDHLRPKHFLLVLDNFEHLSAQTSLLSTILRHAPDVKLLVTSRYRLNSAEEWVYPLRGLDFPKVASGRDHDLEAMKEHEAITLFEYHAQRVQPGFDVAGDLPSVAAICRLVEGMPLALELAASWIRTLSPAQILSEIAGSLGFLVAPGIDPAQPQRSMHATFDRSWELLSARERTVMMRLSVFRGSFTIEAVRYVSQGSLQDLANLRDNSFIRLEAQDRYSIHELIRQYSAEKLGETGEVEASDSAHRRHAIYYTRLVADDERELAVGSHDPFERLQPEWHNIIIAWHWILERQESALFRRIAARFIFYYEGKGWFSRRHAGASTGADRWQSVAEPDADTVLCIALHR